MLGFSASLWKSSCWNSTSICISTTSTTSKYWGWLHWKTRKTRNGILAWTARTATRAANKQINDEKLFQEDNSCSRRSIYKIETTATKLFLARKFKYVYLGVEDVLFKLRKCGLSGAQTSSRSKSNPEKEEESENNSNFAERWKYRRKWLWEIEHKFCRREIDATHTQKRALQKTWGGKKGVLWGIAGNVRGVLW